MTELFFGQEVHNRFHEAAAAVGLPHPGSLKALLLLEAEDPPPMRALAEGMHCDASYMTGLVDALEGLGYVERRPSPSDRRVKLVQLTRAGLVAKAKALEVISTPPKVMERLSDAEARSLARLLGKLS
jgi:MarR family transcriptional regulator, organic hydroperoxide resistance regulator